MSASLLWYRHDLRIDDHPALLRAVARGVVVPVFVWHPADEGRWAPGAASRWWLQRSLVSLEGTLRERGSSLVIRCGEPGEELAAVAKEVGADRVFATARHEPAAAGQESRVAERLESVGIRLEIEEGNLLYPPESIRSGSGDPYKVFTPFWKACLREGRVAPPRAAPTVIPAPAKWPRGVRVESLGLSPRIPWDAAFPEVWTPGVAGAGEKLREFRRGAISSYREARDVPGERGTSLLSPHLHFGEISPRRIWHAVAPREGVVPADTEKFLAELGWREFAHHVLRAFPRTAERPLRPEFNAFPWQPDASLLRAWQRGETGYPMVDAGMRQLWAIGWMHNRVRMVVASFLVKHLLQPWIAGAEWFWDTLVDADLANNTLGWQWSAGCGADAAPYFRIFNPVLQGEKFDPQGQYLRRWLPELAELPPQFIHRPWEAPSEVLARAGITLGREYPRPIVDHQMARERALAALSAIAAKQGDGHAA
jgi:deoxyribodipyrimidine photo-lyase